MCWLSNFPFHFYSQCEIYQAQRVLTNSFFSMVIPFTMSNPSSAAKNPSPESALANAFLQRTLLSNVGVLLPHLPQTGLAIHENPFLYHHANPISPAVNDSHSLIAREIQARMMQAPRLPFLSSGNDASRSTRAVSVCSDNEKSDTGSLTEQPQTIPPPEAPAANDKLLLLSSLATSRLASEGFHVDPPSKMDDARLSTKSVPPKKRAKKSKKNICPGSSQEPKVTSAKTNSSNSSETQTIKRKTKREQFPEKLYRILEELEGEGMDDIISFVNQGSAFEIHQPEAFEEQVIPRYFRQRGISSFKKQLHLYGFARLKTDSRGFAASLVFHHERFQRGQPQLCLLMDRVNKKIGPTKAQLAKQEQQRLEQEASPASGSCPAVSPSTLSATTN